ncbi:OmpH family outer membrane protein [Acinetobacter sp. c3-l95]|uniref:OmpH family outer membrane protein n=1 Tax=Acinetobacter sp. c3-l95 TaxID=3342804 RepID=UPI0035B7D7DC
MKSFAIKSLAVASCLLFSSLSFANYAIVDLQKAALDTNYMKTQMANLEAQLKPQQQKQDALTVELRNLQQKGQQSAGQLKQADIEKLEQEFASKLEEFNQNAASMQQRAQQTMATINQNLAPRIEQATNEIRVQGKYDMILDSKAVLSIDPKADVTSQVTQKVNAVLK